MTDLGNQSFKKIILPSEKLAKAPQPHLCAVPGRRTLLKYKKSTDNVTRDDSQRRFLTQHGGIVATLFRMVATLYQHCNYVLH